MKIEKMKVRAKCSPVLKDAFWEKSHNVFRYEIRGEVSDFYADKKKSEEKDFSEEALASLSKDTEAYSDWLQLLAGD